MLSMILVAVFLAFFSECNAEFYGSGYYMSGSGYSGSGFYSPPTPEPTLFPTLAPSTTATSTVLNVGQQLDGINISTWNANDLNEEAFRLTISETLLIPETDVIITGAVAISNRRRRLLLGGTNDAIKVNYLATLFSGPGTKYDSPEQIIQNATAALSDTAAVSAKLQSNAAAIGASTDLQTVTVEAPVISMGDNDKNDDTGIIVGSVFGVIMLIALGVWYFSSNQEIEPSLKPHHSNFLNEGASSSSTPPTHQAPSIPKAIPEPVSEPAPVYKPAPVPEHAPVSEPIVPPFAANFEDEPDLRPTSHRDFSTTSNPLAGTLEGDLGKQRISQRRASAIALTEAVRNKPNTDSDDLLSSGEDQRNSEHIDNDTL
jgi:hypothetical protein